MNAKTWFGDLMMGNLLVRESLLIAPLLLQKPDSTQWKEEIEIRSLLQKSSVIHARLVCQPECNISHFVLYMISVSYQALWRKLNSQSL